jgi:hypothetical protein
VVWTSEIGDRKVDWVLRTGNARAHAVWALRQVAGGWCVLGSYVSAVPVESPMTLAQKALAGGGTAVALVRFESAPDERTQIATRFVALATDGDRLWLALEGKGGSQLIAREANLRKQGSSLFLDVPMATATAVLKFDGERFVKLN